VGHGCRGSSHARAKRSQVGHATINPDSVGRAEQIDSTLLLQLSLKRKDQRSSESTVTPHAPLVRRPTTETQIVDGASAHGTICFLQVYSVI
jgi:hypothetical protein